MTPDDFRAIRADLGLSQRELAFELGVTNMRTVRRWEAGDIAVPGPVQIVMSYWQRDHATEVPRIAFVEREEKRK